MHLRLRLFFIHVLVLLAPMARAAAQDIAFNLTKRTDVLIFHVADGGAGPAELRDERLSNDHNSVNIAWKYTGFRPLAAQPKNGYIVVKTGGGSEVRLTIRHLPERYVPTVGNVGSNAGEMELAVSGHGPLFDKLRRDLLKTRGMGWDSDADLTFHGGVIPGTGKG